MFVKWEGRLLKMKSKRLGALFLAACFAFAPSASAEIVHIAAKGMYVAGAEESLNSAKNHALEDAMRIVVEQAGVMVNSYSKTNNMVLTEDEVSTVASKIIKIIDKKFEVSMISDYEIKIISYINADVDTDSINEDVIKLKKKNEQLSNQIKIQNNIINKKQQSLESLNILNRDIKDRYVKEFYDKYNWNEKGKILNIESSWVDAIRNFPIHMGRKEYSHAETDLMVARMRYKDYMGIKKPERDRYIDDVIVGLSIRQIETYIAEGEYMSAIRECIWFERLMRDNDYKLNKNSNYGNKFSRYYNILKDYYDTNEPDKWGKILDNPGYPRIG